MAAPICRSRLSNITIFSKFIRNGNDSKPIRHSFNKTFCRAYNQTRNTGLSWRNIRIGASIGLLSSVFAGKMMKDALATTELRPASRTEKGIIDIGDQNITLYQFQSCPYCCKVRATLDFFGFPYSVVEVNSITKSQLNFSDYKKVPVLVVDGKQGDTDFSLQFCDSSLIMSALASYVFDQNTPLNKLQACYPGIKEQKGRKTVWEFPNKYFIMYGDNIADNRSEKERSEERKWRKWVDEVLMHTISPNVYRTPRESLEAFHHFSDWGEWEKNFSTPTRLFVVYAGAVAMYFIGRIVKKRHNIKDNSRESLYEACDTWMEAVGSGLFFHGDKPGLVDLSVYGALHSFQGCQAFKDLMQCHKVKDWYERTEEQIDTHQGAMLLGKKPAHHP
ncbi:prostaglandin E synthase 2-like [Dreissena polymorpha]|uniref:Prostaglandin E synthase 2 n=1 Tax=Dreissena polymorpha TaxID=45954 RepID=A0A9D4QZS6_DREPO|nr:prostaglandin E synthase 2-like [Dreissena polymorpha]KAH3849781.1 hypothetical protein DPMN_092185 [Dreissena polymorpha]